MDRQSIINTFFPGNSGIPLDFNQYYNGEYEAGVDIALPAGAPVGLVENSQFLGTIDNGYVNEWRGLKSGLIEYYQHIQSNPALVTGDTYTSGTNVGTIAPLSDTPYPYSSSGPHLEFGIATDAPSPGQSVPHYARQDPLPVLAALPNPQPLHDASSTETSKGTGSNNNPIITWFSNLGGGISNAASAVGTTANNLNNISWQSVANTLGVGGLFEDTKRAIIIAGIAILAGGLILVLVSSGGKQIVVEQEPIPTTTQSAAN